MGRRCGSLLGWAEFLRAAREQSVAEIAGLVGYDKRLPGKPDVVVARARTIIDIRGCFWHRHGCAVSTMPKSNVAFWMEKWSKNVCRDKRNEKAWREAGWNLIVVWECALAKRSLERTLLRICSALDLWAEELSGLDARRRRPHRLVLPHSP